LARSMGIFCIVKPSLLSLTDWIHGAERAFNPD
jgi:hypothetical protein